MSLHNVQTINAPAKLNLFLHICGKRADGYHLLESLMAPLDFGDQIQISSSDEMQVIVNGESAPIEDNIVLRAIKQFEVSTSVTVKPLSITIEKNIPIGAGLGGGSSDAAAVLCYLKQQYAPELPEHDLVAIGASVGADVPFFFKEASALVKGIGEVLYDVGSIPYFPAIVVNPKVFVSTGDIFSQGFSVYKETRVEVEDIPADAEAFLEFLAHCSNDLVYNAIKSEPVIAEVLSTLKKLPGCRFAQMSGSGATCFALFSDEKSRNKSLQRLQKKKHQWWSQEAHIGSK
jgi:4-diphosphocytidyl-2-C-methyl-D-erythritol kinase